MPKANVKALPVQTDPLAALRERSTKVEPKSKSSSVVVVDTQPEFIPVVDQFVSLKADEKNLKRDLDDTRGQIIKYARPEILTRSQVKRDLIQSIKLTTSGKTYVMVTERAEYPNLAEAALASVREIMGEMFDAYFVTKTTYQISPEALEDAQFVEALVQVAYPFPKEYLLRKETVVPTKSFHAARITDSKLAAVRLRLELNQVVPVCAVQTSD